jgi:hypothetical protein
LANSSEPTRLAIIPSASALLPNGDDRPVGAKLDLLEVLPALPGRTFDFGTAGSVRLAAAGIDQDGWMSRDAVIHFPASTTATEATLRIENPDWSGAPTTTLSTQAGADPAVAHRLAAGAYANLRVRIPASVTPRTVRLSAPADFPLPAPDTRRRTGRLLQVELAPVP